MQCSGISKDMYRQNKLNNLEMETSNIICCNSIKSPFWKCCEMDRHPHPRGMILLVILSQLRRLTLTELLELTQAIIETMNDRYANGCIGDTYDPVVTQMIRKPPTISRQWSHKLDMSFGANRDAHIERHFCMSLRTAKVLNADSVRSSMAYQRRMSLRTASTD